MEFRKQLLQDKFKNSLLYACYNFYETYKNKPASYKELAEFITLKNVEATIQEYIKNIQEASKE